MFGIKAMLRKRAGCVPIACVCIWGSGCLLLSGCTLPGGETALESQVLSTDSDADFDSMLSGGQTVYQTDIVKRGHFSRSSSFEGVVYYPELSPVIYEGEQAVLTEWLVEQGSRVKKGEPVANIQIEYDEVALKEQELTLERLKSDYEWQRVQMEKDLEEKRKQAVGASAQSREALEYRKAEKELELYCLSMEQRVEAQQKSVREFWERISVTTVNAPIDGVVSELSYLKSGEYLPQGESLMVLYNPEVVWLQVTDANAALRYNMEVTIETGPPKNRVTVFGRVIAADNILPDSLRRGLAFVELSELPDDINWSNTSIRADLVSMEEVLLINRLAVESDTGGTFVYLLEDGSLHKRQVIRAGQGLESSWILMGLEEGQEVVIP